MNDAGIFSTNVQTKAITQTNDYQNNEQHDSDEEFSSGSDESNLDHDDSNSEHEKTGFIQGIKGAIGIKGILGMKKK
jgi:hypothetical protein